MLKHHHLQMFSSSCFFLLIAKLKQYITLDNYAAQDEALIFTFDVKNHSVLVVENILTQDCLLKQIHLYSICAQ